MDFTEILLSQIVEIQDILHEKKHQGSKILGNLPTEESFRAAGGLTTPSTQDALRSPVDTWFLPEVGFGDSVGSNWTKFSFPEDSTAG